MKDTLHEDKRRDCLIDILRNEGPNEGGRSLGEHTNIIVSMVRNTRKLIRQFTDCMIVNFQHTPLRHSQYSSGMIHMILYIWNDPIHPIECSVLLLS